MALQASVSKKVFEFNFTARTSRGRMKDRTSWFIKLWDDASPSVFGLGECAPLPGLSMDDKPDYEVVLNRVAENVSTLKVGSLTLLKRCCSTGSFRISLDTFWIGNCVVGFEEWR
jgi:hypothetical protein